MRERHVPSLSPPKAGFAREDAVGARARAHRALQGKAMAMMRTLIAVSVVTATVLLTTLGLTLSISYVVNERCSDQMAQQGNC